MKAWLNRCARQMFAALGLIERRRLQPVPVPSDERRRLAEGRRH
ncbi:MAG: PA1414 family protein [Pseudomonas sp.]